MTNETSPLPAVGYCRVSTDEQDVSLEAQQKQIRAMATVKGWELADMLVDRDSFSGDMNRAGLKAVLELVRTRKVSAVIITKLDRLSRSTRDVIHLMELLDKKKVALVSIVETLDTKSPTGRFFLRMLASMGELERETIGYRTRVGMEQLKSLGMPVGPAPYGYRAPKRNKDVPLHQKSRLLLDESEQAILERVRKLHQGKTSLRKIAEQLNAEGLRTRSGAEWRFQYVARLVGRIEGEQQA